MDVSIIIVNYKTREMVLDCIQSVRALTRDKSYEVIVVDNASDDGMGDALRRCYGDEVKFVPLDRNIGFGRANNAGFHHASGRYLLCLNPDTLLVNDAVSEMVRFMDSMPQAGACGANLFGRDRRPALSFRRLLPGFRWEINELLHLIPERVAYGKNRIFNHTGRPLKVGYITGADLMIRRTALKQTGHFRREFFMYYEETDLCRRLTDAHWEIYSVPAAEIIHLEGASFGDAEMPSLARIRRSEDGRKVYYRLNFCPLKRMALNAIYFLLLTSRILLVRDKKKRYIWRGRLKAFIHKTPRAEESASVKGGVESASR